MYYINTCINTINMILVLTCTCRYPSMCLFFISVHEISFLGHLSHSGDLLLWVGVRRRASCVVRRALTSSPQKLLGQS